MTETQVATESPCSLCSERFELSALIRVAGYPVCRGCLERVSDEVGARHGRVYKAREGRQIAGVCGGLADAMNVDRSTMRIIVLVVGAVTGIFPVVIAYFILALVLPTEP